MTMLSTGSNQKYADNWEAAFAGKKSAGGKTTRGKSAAKSAAKATRSSAKPKAAAKKSKSGSKKRR